MLPLRLVDRLVGQTQPGFSNPKMVSEDQKHGMPRISNGSRVYAPSDHTYFHNKLNVESSSSASSVVAAAAESIPWPDNRSRVVAESTTAQNVFFGVVVAAVVDPADKVWWGLRASKHSLWTCPLIIFVSCHQEDVQL